MLLVVWMDDKRRMWQFPVFFLLVLFPLGFYAAKILLSFRSILLQLFLVYIHSFFSTWHTKRVTRHTYIFCFPAFAKNNDTNLFMRNMLQLGHTFHKILLFALKTFVTTRSPGSSTNSKLLSISALCDCFTPASITIQTIKRLADFGGTGSHKKWNTAIRRSIQDGREESWGISSDEFFEILISHSFSSLFSLSLSAHIPCKFQPLGI